MTMIRGKAANIYGYPTLIDQCSLFIKHLLTINERPRVCDHVWQQATLQPCACARMHMHACIYVEPIVYTEPVDAAKEYAEEMALFENMFNISIVYI